MLEGQANKALQLTKARFLERVARRVTPLKLRAAPREHHFWGLRS